MWLQSKAGGRQTELAEDGLDGHLIHTGNMAVCRFIQRQSSDTLQQHAACTRLPCRLHHHVGASSGAVGSTIAEMRAYEATSATYPCSLSSSTGLRLNFARFEGLEEILSKNIAHILHNSKANEMDRICFISLIDSYESTFCHWMIAAGDSSGTIISEMTRPSGSTVAKSRCISLSACIFL